MEGLRENAPEEILEVVADKGYENEETEADTANTNPEELRKSLHAGKVPEAYKDVIFDVKVEVVRRKVKDDETKDEKVKSPYGTQEEMMERAKEEYLIRDPERNLVYCPAGELLRQKCISLQAACRIWSHS